MNEYGLPENERVGAIVESAYQIARERKKAGEDSSGDGSLLFRMARELEALYSRVYGAGGLLYQLEMANNMLSFYKELAEETKEVENE